jgi:hypothetical protein
MTYTKNPVRLVGWASFPHAVANYTVSKTRVQRALIFSFILARPV